MRFDFLNLAIDIAMTPEQNQQRHCEACDESEPSSPSYIHTVAKNDVLRRICTDCLLKEHRELFCSLCLNVFHDEDDDLPTPQHDRIICLNCSATIHLSCSPSSTADSSFTCPPCSDPDFSFFPKSRDPGGLDSTKTLVAAAKIAVFSLKNAAAKLREDASKKILAAKLAKIRATEALGNLQEAVIRENASKKSNPNKRKSSEV
ncbi:unnamed protein product [Cochlearia groenlandica]